MRFSSCIRLAFWRWVVAVLIFLPFAWKPLMAQRDIVKKHLPYLFLQEEISSLHFYCLLLIVTGILTANYER